MKTNIIILIIAAALTAVSCETTEMPRILDPQLGYEGNGSVVQGEELHIEAEIIAEGTIDVIEVEIHSEGEHDHAKKSSYSLQDEGWELDTTYTGFSGLKNTEFHEHIEIPLTAAPGEYHFHMKVTDLDGYQEQWESEFEIVAAGK